MPVAHVSAAGGADRSAADLLQIWDYKISFMAPEAAPARPGSSSAPHPSRQRQLLDKRAERDSAQKELEKKQTDRAARTRESSSPSRGAAGRKAAKVDVPAVVALRELARSREDLALARREVAYLKTLHRAVEGATETAALARKRDRCCPR